MKLQQSRKQDHIKYHNRCPEVFTDYFQDMTLLHQAVPEVHSDKIDTSIHFLGRQQAMPIMINAMTGGQGLGSLNQDLASLAKAFQIPIAVGSQSIALNDPKCRDTFTIVRDIVGDDGTVIANLGAGSSIDRVKMAVEMIDADAIQLHLNVAQELVMPEGDRDFRGILDNIETIVHKVDKPVIIKETGCGIDYKTASKLVERGVQYIDVGGRGGTNFIMIENMRQEEDYAMLADWGIPTPESLVWCKPFCKEISIIASGGIYHAEQAIKALVLGAKQVGLSGMILRKLMDEGYESVYNYLAHFQGMFRIYMTLLGCEQVGDLTQAPYIYSKERSIKKHMDTL